MSVAKVSVKLSTFRLDEKPCLLQYANHCRANGLFNDVTITVGDESIAANRMVLSCYCQFFEKKLKNQPEEEVGGAIELTGVEAQSLKLLIDFMYNGELFIDSYTVVDVLNCASRLEMSEIRQFCFDYVEQTMTPINCLGRLAIAKSFENYSFKRRVHLFISENYQEVAEGDEFLELSGETLISTIYQLQRSRIQESFLCQSLMAWIKHDEESRKSYLKELLKLIDFNRLPLKHLKMLAEDDMLKDEEKYQNLINLRIKRLMQTGTQIYKCVCAPLTLRHSSLAPLRGICAGCVFSEERRSKECKRKVHGPIPSEYYDQHENQSKILSIGGKRTNSKLIEVLSLTEETDSSFPDLPAHLITRHALKFNKAIYCFGVFSKIFKMDLYQSNLQWEELSLTKTKTKSFGATVFNDTLVVCMGFDGETQMYKTNLNQWDLMAPLNIKRLKIELASTSQCLFAVGGHDGWKSVSAVERLFEVGGAWEEVAPMNTPRHAFAVINYHDVLYAIGGEDQGKKKLNSVEKYDPVANEWVSVRNMKNERWKLAACVFFDKIFVIGGLNSNGEVIKEIEYYDPDTDTWETFVGKIDNDLYGHTLIVV